MSKKNYDPQEPSFAQKSPQYVDIIRLWKDEEYRNNLTDEERAQFEEESAQVRKMSSGLPGNPAGAIELTDNELRDALNTGAVCSKYGSISTTWCDNPRVC